MTLSMRAAVGRCLISLGQLIKMAGLYLQPGMPQHCARVRRLDRLSRRPS